ncbi:MULTISPECIES: hypothetical protein [unclassified Mesorhizobium]|uniref:hypothetical protein n=1 Tax=unclassified Mesorhizobium TaxID=325217 RepID=UPI001676C159|nr:MULTISPECIES: hypothetical protein [unclassified Mesorhizobium]
MGEVGRAIERDALGEHKRQADFRTDQRLAPLRQFVCDRYQIENSLSWALDLALARQGG